MTMDTKINPALLTFKYKAYKKKLGTHLALHALALEYPELTPDDMEHVAKNSDRTSILGLKDSNE